MAVRAQGVFSRNAINAFAYLTTKDGSGTTVNPTGVNPQMVPLLMDSDPFDGKSVGVEGAKFRRFRVKALESIGSAYVVRLFLCTTGTPRMIEEEAFASSSLSPSTSLGIDASDWFEVDRNLAPNSIVYATISVDNKILVEAEFLDMNNEALPTTGSGT